MTGRFAFASRVDAPGAFESWLIVRGRYADPADASVAAACWVADMARHGIPVVVQVGEIVTVDGDRRFRPTPVVTDSEAA